MIFEMIKLQIKDEIQSCASKCLDGIISLFQVVCFGIEIGQIEPVGEVVGIFNMIFVS